MTIEDVKSPAIFLIDENCEVIRGGQNLNGQDLNFFIEGFAKRIRNYKGSYINGQNVINSELCDHYKKENLIKNQK